MNRLAQVSPVIETRVVNVSGKRTVQRHQDLEGGRGQLQKKKGSQRLKRQTVDFPCGDPTEIRTRIIRTGILHSIR
jgi:hypothetical protein